MANSPQQTGGVRRAIGDHPGLTAAAAAVVGAAAGYTVIGPTSNQPSPATTPASHFLSPEQIQKLAISDANAANGTVRVNGVTENRGWLKPYVGIVVPGTTEEIQEAVSGSGCAVIPYPQNPNNEQILIMAIAQNPGLLTGAANYALARYYGSSLSKVGGNEDDLERYKEEFGIAVKRNYEITGKNIPPGELTDAFYLYNAYVEYEIRTVSGDGSKVARAFVQDPTPYFNGFLGTIPGDGSHPTSPSALPTPRQTATALGAIQARRRTP